MGVACCREGRTRKSIEQVGIATLAALAGGMAAAEHITTWAEDKMYQDRVVFASTSAVLLGAGELSPRVVGGGALILLASLLAALQFRRPDATAH